MDWIKQVAILFVFASGLLVQTSARTRSKLHPTERFEFCVARNLSGLSMFNEEDKERMEKIVMETIVRMREMKEDPENAFNAKTMLRLFAAALACVVADCDSSVRPQREQACITALEACALSLKEPAGAEVVKEMKKIFAAMSREISVLDEIADNSAPVETKRKERLEKEEDLEDEIREEKKGFSEEDMTEKKEEHSEEDIVEKKEERSEKESEAKERPKRAYVNTFRYQGPRMRPQSNPTLESIIADKLLKSSTFNNFFNFGLSQEDAVFYSRSMAASGLSGYRYDIIEEAMNAVAAALSRLGSFAGPNDYAYTIGRSIASVLSAHELTFYADGLGIGSSLVYQLDSMLGSNPSSTFALSPSFGAASSGSFDSASAASSGWGSSSAAASSQSGGVSFVQMNPSYVDSSFAVPSNPQNDKSQFQNRLSNFLSQSPEISRKFCNGPFPGVYEVMNSAFTDYGYPISSTIATVVSNSLNMLPTEAACTQYAEVISEVVADILNNNGYILTADPQVITNKISDLMSSNIQSSPPQNPSSSGQQTFGDSEYQLNPSFEDYSYSAPEIPALPEDQISGSVPDTPIQQDNPVLSNPTEFSFDASAPAIQPSSIQDLPAELSSGGLDLSDESQLNTDGATGTNNSWVVIDYPTDALPALDKMNQTSGSIDVAPPMILEPGPVIPVNVPPDTESALESKLISTYKTTTAPKVVEVTRSAEVTTPVPLSTNFQISTVAANSEASTPAPGADLKDAFESPSKLSDFLMKEMTSSLKTLNVTSGDAKKQSDLPKTSTGVNAPQTADSPTTLDDSKPAEQSSDSQVKTSTEVQPSLETPQQQNGPSDEIPLIAPAPITDELSALVFADKVSSIVSSSISLIRSPNFQFDELCRRLNELAPMVDLPPLDLCSELPLIDYLLHILNAVTYSLAGEK
ncbi:unnamed protein product [Larinioides sclopetarius]|uniref:Uncharacterized protein n=1 Tax=Larinioides sclopetarius TaxID=280406 RepID=A0AAV2BQ96_9ARAC